MKRFLEGSLAGSYEKELTAEFKQLLPDRQPWKRQTGA
jgi:hypothetical protein